MPANLEDLPADLKNYYGNLKKSMNPQNINMGLWAIKIGFAILGYFGAFYDNFLGCIMPVCGCAPKIVFAFFILETDFELYIYLIVLLRLSKLHHESKVFGSWSIVPHHKYLSFIQIWNIYSWYFLLNCIYLYFVTYHFIQFKLFQSLTNAFQTVEWGLKFHINITIQTIIARTIANLRLAFF